MIVFDKVFKNFISTFTRIKKRQTPTPSLKTDFTVSDSRVTRTDVE